jgi:hypothetical protein
MSVKAVITLTEQMKEYLIYYFTGRYDHIIKVFKGKLKEKIPDDLYCSIVSIDYTRIRIENVNDHSDPTGELATKIADLQLDRVREYNHYLLLRQLIEDIIKELNHNDIKLIKTYLGISSSLAVTARKLNISYEKAQKQTLVLMDMLDKKITRGLIMSNIPPIERRDTVYCRPECETFRKYLGHAREGVWYKNKH